MLSSSSRSERAVCGRLPLEFAPLTVGETVGMSCEFGGLRMEDDGGEVVI